MEWLLIFNLWMTEVSNPPPVPYPSKAECNEAAKKMADQYKWLYYFEVEGTQFDQGVMRPRVFCEPAEWHMKNRKLEKLEKKFF